MMFPHPLCVILTVGEAAIPTLEVGLRFLKTARVAARFRSQLRRSGGAGLPACASSDACGLSSSRGTPRELPA
jgi:hypothetical protein